MTEPSKDLVVQSTAYSRANLTERQQYVAMLARAGDLLPAHLRGRPVKDENGQLVPMGNAGKTFLLAETGDMLGIHPMAAMTGVHIIEGKPSISANLMTGLVRKAGHKLRVTVTGEARDESLKAVAQLIRSDDPDFTHEVTWTVEDAKRALLWPGKEGSNWRKYPKAMMKARAISEIIREAAAEVLMGGNVYTPEELGAQVDEHGDPINMPQVRDEQPTAAPSDAPQQAPAEPRPETPIPTAAEEPTDFDWSAAIRDATNVEEVKDLYRRARAESRLDMEIKVGRKKRLLGEVLTEIGKAFAEAAKAAAEQPSDEALANADTDTGEVIVDAEIVEDDGPAVLSEEPK